MAGSLIVLSCSLTVCARAIGNNYKFPSPFESDTVYVSVIGDVMLHAKQINSDYEPFLNNLSERFKRADIAIANMEFTLAGKPYTGYPAFSAPDKYAEYVRKTGINLFLTANNHIMDKGIKGLKRTIDVYKKMKEDGIMFTGISEDEHSDTTSNPLIKEIKGIKIAFINFTYGTNVANPEKWPKVNMMDTSDISAALNRAKRHKADYIIVLPHWGYEYNLMHSKEQENFALWLAKNGADIIIGAHPHVVQPLREIHVTIDGNDKKVPVYYSLGNAVSNMSAINTRIGLLVNLKLKKDGAGRPEEIRHSAEFLWCTLPGRLTHSYSTIPVKEFYGLKNLWKQPSDYMNMIETYKRIKNISGITEEK